MRKQIAVLLIKNISNKGLIEITKNNNLRKVFNYEDPSWLNLFLSKACNIKSNLPYSIFYKSVKELLKEYTLPTKLTNELKDCSHIVAVYLDSLCYKKERLLYYHTDQAFREIGNSDHACRLLSKIKLIALNNRFDQYAEQELGLTIGLFNRMQIKNRYEIKSIDEQLYYDIKGKFSNDHEKELIHIIAISPLQEKK